MSVLGTDKSQKEPYQENMGDEKAFNIHIQSQAVVMATCDVWAGALSCKSRKLRVSQFSSPLSFDFLVWPPQFACIVSTV